jgi:hypothetical protein
MRALISKTLKEYIIDFAKRYHHYRLETDQLSQVRYRIVSSLETYQHASLITLSLTDRPGDLLPAMSINEIKKCQDIISGMHPVDVNSLNDLYYLSHDQIIEMRVSDDKIIVVNNKRLVVEYDLNRPIDLNTIISTRLSYMIGYIQAEKLFRDAYKEKVEYKIICDNIVTLQIKDNEGQVFLKKPTDILFTDEYKKFSKEDIAKIGYICGQMAHSSFSHQAKDNIA